MRWIFILLLALPVQAIYAVPQFPTENYGRRLTLPHLYPGQSVTTGKRFLMEPLGVGESTVKWTRRDAYSVRVDKVHLLRNTYTLIVRSKWGPEIRFVPFTAKELVLGPDTYQLDFDKYTYTVWLAKYAD